MRPLNAYDVSVGVFVRGLSNLKAQLRKAEDHAATSGSGEASLLSAQLSTDLTAGAAPADLHRYALAAHVHWAAEGALLAIAQLLGASRVPTQSDAKSFAELYQRLDAAIESLQKVAPDDLEAGLDRMIEHRRGVRASGSQFLLAFAIPHFTYHLTTAYGILRNQGVPLTMGDFLGDWGSAPKS
jgi:hypothetical protein